MAAKVALWLIRLVVGGVFIYAGALKVWPAENFARDIQHYAIIPWPSLTALVAVYLPWVEILSGLAVIFQRLYLGGLAVITGLTIIFLAAISSAWVRGLDISCGCFGKEERSIKADYPRLVMQDFAILAGSAVLLVAERRKRHFRENAGPLPP